MSKLASVASSTSVSDSEEEQDTICNQLYEISEDQPTYGNISVAGSSDVHLGSRTFYQGSVTINQVLYENLKNSQRDVTSVTNVTSGNGNEEFVPDQVGEVNDGNDPGNIIQKETLRTKGTRWLRSSSTIQVLRISFLATVPVLTLVILLVMLLTKNQSPVQFDYSTELPVDSPTWKLRVVSRKEWSAQTAKEVVPLKLPVRYVIIMHTGSQFCSDEERCKEIVRRIQISHVESKGRSDIGYSFLVGGDGNAYEGRGWFSVGSQVAKFDDICIGIAFIGTFDVESPPYEQLRAAQELIKMGVNLGAISPDYSIYTERQLRLTNSPGEALYNIVKTWDYFSPIIMAQSSH
ncbi:hypothetical protein PPYR_15491 [Photinus pyralis]|uniref:Peptidoglycan recognition protein family domain-containing protein n=1 Tax=Photinus pyralis TaxID=7054 RepID=A0A5N3ZYP9_PHOPY|nr:peptidoglycan-recognition protein LF-like [Photinus pyralis]KAB0790181.1 hypothetical protein PPYR_15491 [Photinus pyralis]